MNFLYIFLISLNIQFLQIFGNETPKGNRILKGYYTNIVDYPYVVSIEYDREHVCGGSLFHRDYILTVASALWTRKVVDKYKVRVGSSIKEARGVLYSVKDFTLHPNYDIMKYGHDYNIAIIRLSEPVSLGINVDLISLPKKDEILTPEDKPVVVGYGETEKDCKECLQAKQLRVYTDEECSSIFENDGYRIRLTPRQFCAGRIGICNLDFGGPLVLNRIVYGIASSRKQDCLFDYPSRFTKVSVFVDWIHGAVEQLKQI